MFSIENRYFHFEKDSTEIDRAKLEITAGHLLGKTGSVAPIKGQKNILRTGKS